MSEQLHPSNERINDSELTEAAGEQLKKLENNSENLNDTEQRQGAERDARSDAEKLAIAGKEQSAGERKNTQHAGSPQRITRKLKGKQYKETLKDVQLELPKPERAFSKVIHNPAIEKVSDLTGKTIARPNAILAGSITACLLVVAVYLLAKTIGFRLSGFETIASFILGWLLGIVIDIIRVTFQRRSL